MYSLPERASNALDDPQGTRMVGRATSAVSG